MTRAPEFQVLLRGPPVAADGLTEHMIAAARALAEAHPLVATRTLAAGLSAQPKGGKMACLREFVSGLLRGDRTLGDLIARELGRLSRLEGASSGEASSNNVATFGMNKE